MLSANVKPKTTAATSRGSLATARLSCTLSQPQYFFAYKTVNSSNCKAISSRFLDPEGGSQKATLVVLLLVISSLKIPKAFLMRSGAQRNFAYTFTLTLPTDLLSQIFHLFSDY